MSSTPFDLVAGTEEFYFDADYYDYEFKSRKDDVAWYVKRYLEYGGETLELGVGSGVLRSQQFEKAHGLQGLIYLTQC